jgi:hypothetical protein
MHVDLGGGKADAGCRVHGFGHVGDQLLQAVVENGDGCGDFMEPGVGVAQYVQKRHLGRISLAN